VVAGEQGAVETKAKIVETEVAVVGRRVRADVRIVGLGVDETR
jgi:hypothetical protein